MPLITPAPGLVYRHIGCDKECGAPDLDLSIDVPRVSAGSIPCHSLLFHYLRESELPSFQSSNLPINSLLRPKKPLFNLHNEALYLCPLDRLPVLFGCRARWLE